MIHIVLVPLDGSKFAEFALPLAASIARRHGAMIKVVQVHTMPAGAYGEAVLAFDEMSDLTARANENAFLNGVVERLSSAGVTAGSALLDQNGLPVPAVVCRFAVAESADLVIMTTHGRGPLARFWLGSIADGLLRQAPVPVLLVQPHAAPPEPAHEPVFSQVLIPLDGSELAEQILEPATELGAAMQAEYTLLQVVKPVVPDRSGASDMSGGGADASLLERMKDLHTQMEADARRYLDLVAERLQARSLRVQTRVVFHDQPAVAILDDVRAHGIDLIALATRGLGGWSRMLLGSVADKVVRGSSTPVLVCRPSRGQYDQE